MTIETAKAYLAKDIYQMNLDQLQKHYVHLLDAWREYNLEYGIQQAVQNGFYVLTPEVHAVTPADFWLSHNLLDSLTECETLLQEMRRKDRTK